MNANEYTNDKAAHDAIADYRNAMVADGWEMAALYGPDEPLESYAKGTKEGFVCHVCARDLVRMGEIFPHMRNNKPKHRYNVAITIWAADGLVVRAPAVYSWEELKSGIRKCPHCGAKDVETHRYGFAGRACEKCLPALKKAHEYPGWCD